MITSKKIQRQKRDDLFVKIIMMTQTQKTGLLRGINCFLLWWSLHLAKKLGIPVLEWDFAMRFLLVVCFSVFTGTLEKSKFMANKPRGSATQYLILHLREQKQKGSLVARLHVLQAFRVLVGFNWGRSLKKMTRDPLMMYVWTPLVSKYLLTSWAFTTSWYTYLRICNTSWQLWSFKQCWQNGLHPQVMQKKVQSFFFECLCFSHGWKKSLLTSSKSHLKSEREREREREEVSLVSSHSLGHELESCDTRAYLIVFFVCWSLLRLEGLSSSIFTWKKNLDSVSQMLTSYFFLAKIESENFSRATYCVDGWWHIGMLWLDSLWSKLAWLLFSRNPKSTNFVSNVLRKLDWLSVYKDVERSPLWDTYKLDHQFQEEFLYYGLFLVASFFLYSHF